jgi:hypothetical protein
VISSFPLFFIPPFQTVAGLFGSKDFQKNFGGINSKGKESLHSVWNEGMLNSFPKERNPW